MRCAGESCSGGFRSVQRVEEGGGKRKKLEEGGLFQDIEWKKRENLGVARREKKSHAGKVNSPARTKKKTKQKKLGKMDDAVFAGQPRKNKIISQKKEHKESRRGSGLGDKRG